VFGSGTEFDHKSPIFAFSFLLFTKVDFGVSNVFVVIFADEHGRLPHFSIGEDGSLCSMGQHRSGILKVLWDALISLSYDRDVPLYHCHPF
jgi:hypothetical protein